MIRALIFIIIMGAVVMFFWHDEIGGWVKEGQKQAEEKVPGLINAGLTESKDWWETYGQDWADQLVADLTVQGKAKIDDWLAERDLNQYGDSRGTLYTGGTPLFDESTGQATDRYAYLLDKFPDLVSQLNLSQYLGN
ncbi:MAG: hypothetical protein UV78_C0030G0020 [Parcubacteria group bacterium GW2011_GWA2_43_17]|nr:MAG: hypothetical protein UV78_C0030G0020 [Parcubacteria group bacterium GW2011_GWA2_43_17]KKT92858.1 MAG: hypothetical protein UW91_C0015G0029 [Parcubacteria group bacterium GW2011_GWF2_45_11]KKT96918.1 MAG: hypothetical protein UW98_C0031G0017 [Parcubacteria group bacterium GW2011_GWC2_45_15]OGY95932.1 MAG: hypothetical protein A3J95_00465 [Candidatus Komeilibacteria bacterium RIFOXYC2_FULL_45_12]